MSPMWTHRPVMISLVVGYHSWSSPLSLSWATRAGTDLVIGLSGGWELLGAPGLGVLGVEEFLDGAGFPLAIGEADIGLVLGDEHAHHAARAGLGGHTARIEFAGNLA